MKLILLGTSGYHPTDDRQTACMMLPEIGVVLDCGTAFYRVADALATDELDIFLTHAHLDHVIGLTYLFNLLSRRAMRRVTVHAEPDKLKALDQHLWAEPLFPAKPPFTCQALSGDVSLPHGGRLHSFPVPHPGGAVGYRLDWPDRSMAYVTDTTAAPEADYVDAIRGVDLLVHECHFSDDRSDQAALTGHSCVTPVAQLAAAAKVGRLVLVHFDPLLSEDDPVDVEVARAIFPATDLGADKMVVEF